MRKILTIIGPTACGKSALAVELAEKLNGEIIGLDSRQIYKGMPHGTAQPTEKEKKGIPHHLFGFRDPWRPISAGEYAKLIKEKVLGIDQRGHTPIICGGAGLYYRAITKGIFEGSVSDLPTRGRLEQAYEEDPAILLERLRSVDPDYAQIVHINNKKRLVRALEIYEATGKPPSQHFNEQDENQTSVLDLFPVLLCMGKDFLNDRINQRTKQMLASGWIDEVKTLLEKQNELDSSFPGLDSIGYKQIQAFLKGEMTEHSMEEDIALRTRQFSRRQVKWFRKEKIEFSVDMSHLDRDKVSGIISDIYNCLTVRNQV